MKTIKNAIQALALIATLSPAAALAGRPSVGEQAFVNKLICALPIEAGMCKAAFHRWGYENGQCVEFIYGGCGGNGNNFASQEACEAACGQPQEQE